MGTKKFELNFRREAKAHRGNKNIWKSVNIRDYSNDGKAEAELDAVSVDSDVVTSTV